MLNPYEHPGFLLKQVYRLFERIMEQALSPLSLTFPQFIVLAVLSVQFEKGTPSTQKAVSEATDLTKMVVTQVTRSLLKKGLITRIKSPSDARSNILSLTPQGSTLFASAYHIAQKTENDFFKKAPPALSPYLLDTLKDAAKKGLFPCNCLKEHGILDK